MVKKATPAKAKKPSTRASVYWLLFFIFIFSLQTIPNLYMDSAVNDETLDIFAGYRCWFGDVLAEKTHPPFSKALESLPLLGMNLHSQLNPKAPTPQTRTFCFFSISNPDRAELMVESARWVNLVLFGWGVGWLLFLITRRWPFPSFLAAMALWAFNPLFLAYSTLAKEDLPVTFFFLAAILANEKSNERSSPRLGLSAGFLTGLAIVSKFTGLALAAILPILDFLKSLQGPRSLKSQAMPLLAKWGLQAFGAILIIALVYLPATFYEPAHLEPFHYFQDSLSLRITGPPIIYFEGTLSGQNHPLYYPIIFLLKTPISFLLLLALGYWLMVFKKISVPLWQWLPGPFFFILLSPMENNGIRNALPAFPFFILVAARSAGFLWDWRPSLAPQTGKYLAAGLLLFQVFSVAGKAPISYSNEWLPPAKKIFWLGPMDLDAGQDVKRAALFAEKKGWKQVKLAYVGPDDPKSYGMNWDYWREADLKAPQPGWVYLVNVGFLQMGPAYIPQADLLLRGWLTQTRPTGKIGDTWYYFEIPGRAQPDHSKIIISAPLFGYYYKQFGTTDFNQYSPVR